MNATVKLPPDVYAPTPQVTITDVQIPFGSMVTLFVKVGLAIIPAALIVLMVWALGVAVLAMVVRS